jgi:hypothetical protein
MKYVMTVSSLFYNAHSSVGIVRSFETYGSQTNSAPLISELLNFAQNVILNRICSAIVEAVPASDIQTELKDQGTAISSPPPRPLWRSCCTHTYYIVPFKI